MGPMILAMALAAACDGAPYHALDFWLGDWEVKEGNEVVATSRIERISDGCAIRETYRQKDGYNGTSMTFRDPVLGKWRQTWVDTRGAVGEFSGDVVDGVMKFTGETHTPEGVTVLRRMSLAPEKGKIRQTSFASRDGGATWKPHYEIIYTPRESSPPPQSRQ